MIKISKPWIEKKDSKSYIMANFQIPKEATKSWKEFAKKCDTYSYLRENYDFANDNVIVWYQVEEEYGDFLCVDRNDGFLVGILHYAMATGQDIQSEHPISSRLLFNLNYILIPTLCNPYSGFKRIFIHAKEIKEPCQTKGEVGAGMSCGVDSLHTIHSLSADYIGQEYKLTFLTFIDTGASHYVPHIDKNSPLEIINAEADKIHRNKMKRAEEVAKELNMNLVEIRSNISDVYQGMFSQTNIYRNISAILCLQKFFGRYYYSSAGYRIKEYTPSLYKDPAHSEQLVIPCLSTNGMDVVCSGISRPRYIKTIEIADNPITKKYLNVCNLDKNCGHCAKCYRTLITLDIIGKLNEYYNIFDIEAYRKRKWKSFLWLVLNRKTDEFAIDLYKHAKELRKIPLKIKILGAILLPIEKVKRIVWKQRKINE